MKIKHLGFAVCALLICTFALCSCNRNFLTYADAERYTLGGTTYSATVEHLEIEWLSGSVNIRYHEGDTVSFSETATRTLTEESTLHYLQDENTLHIKFAKSGAYLKNNVKKDLTVYLPASTLLQKMEVETISAKVDVDGITANTIDVESISGAISLTNSTVDGGDVSLESVSGEIVANLKGSTNSLNAQTTSGKMDLVVSQLNTFDLESTSGKISLSTPSVPTSGVIENTSGTVSLALPSNADFKIKEESISGKFQSDIALTTNGDEHVSGTGANLYRIETVSGNIYISAYHS